MIKQNYQQNLVHLYHFFFVTAKHFERKYSLHIKMSSLQQGIDYLLLTFKISSPHGCRYMDGVPSWTSLYDILLSTQKQQCHICRKLLVKILMNNGDLFRILVNAVNVLFSSRQWGVKTSPGQSTIDFKTVAQRKQHWLHNVVNTFTVAYEVMLNASRPNQEI